MKEVFSWVWILSALSRLSGSPLGRGRFTFTYDFNGNCLTDGQRTYTWDSSNRIQKMVYANGDSTEFTYNGAGQRVLMKEFVSGNTTPVSVLRYVWLGSKIVEQRDEAGTTLLKRYHGRGVEICSGARTGKYFYTTDHLGSVREISDATGRVVLARFDYDPWGNRVQVAGDPAYVGVIDEVGFTGHFWHAKSGLWLTWFRGYDAGVGRWVSRDPIGEEGGIGLYNYVDNSPVTFDDLLGLTKRPRGQSQPQPPSPPRPRRDSNGNLVYGDWRDYSGRIRYSWEPLQAYSSAPGYVPPSPYRTIIRFQVDTNFTYSPSSNCARINLKLVGHHTFSREVINPRDGSDPLIPLDLAQHPFIRGVRGNPNIWRIPEDLHREIHPAYNTRLIQEIRNIERTRPLTLFDLLNIRESLAREFNFFDYRPTSYSSPCP